MRGPQPVGAAAGSGAACEPHIGSPTTARKLLRHETGDVSWVLRLPHAFCPRKNMHAGQTSWPVRLKAAYIRFRHIWMRSARPRAAAIACSPPRAMDGLLGESHST